MPWQRNSGGGSLPLLYQIQSHVRHIPANKESQQQHYELGWATSLMHLGIAEP